MIVFLNLLLRTVVAPFKTKRGRSRDHLAAASAERAAPARPFEPELVVVDRLPFVWRDRRFPSVLNAVTIRP